MNYEWLDPSRGYVGNLGIRPRYSHKIKQTPKPPNYDLFELESKGIPFQKKGCN